MQSSLGTSICVAFIAWLISRDFKTRPKVSAATWLPTIWVLILSSRPVSTWFGAPAFQENAAYSLDGSPVDRNLFVVLILLSFAILQKRQIQWGTFIRDNKGIMVLYAYLALTVLWASSPFVSGKRWIKDFGNILVVLVILSERNPQEAMRAVFVRCAYVLLPLSVLVLRYFPDIGRSYNRHTGAMEAIGLALQKNSLGAQVLVTGLILVWDIVHRLQLGPARSQKVDLGIRAGMLVLGAYLLKVSDSKTAIVCLVIGSGIIAGIGIKVVRRNAARWVVWGAAAAALVFLADQLFGISERLVASLGRDMTLTGRTAIWGELLGLHTDPLVGCGYMNLWSDFRYLNKLPEFATHSAHSGYLELYLDGGLVAVALLLAMLAFVGRSIYRHMLTSGEYGLVRFAILVVSLIYNVSESNFYRMTPVWFLFLLAAVMSSMPPATPLSRSQPARVRNAASSMA